MARRNPNLKKAGAETEYTAQRIIELKRCASDPIYFIKNYVKIQHPTRGSISFKLFKYQEEMIKAFLDNRYTIILSARQTGKALAIDTPIPTPHGWTTMENIKVGDIVLGADGKPTAVTFATPVMYDHQCYKVTFSNGESLIADADHLWEVNDTFTHKKVVRTTKYLVTAGSGPRPDGKTCRYSIDVTKPLDLPEQDLSIDPYVLGTWLGDGTSSRGEFTVHQSDVGMYQLHENTYESFRIRPVKSRPHILQCCIKELNKELKDLHVINNKHIPQQYLRASREQRISLLQGLMDTDGTIDKTRGGCELTLSNNRLADDAYELMCSLGLKPTKKKCIKGGFETNSIIFTPYIDDFEVFRLPRKLQRQKQSSHHSRTLSTKRRSILSIEPVESVPVKCIMVDNVNHLFLAGKGMIPTHNSTVSAAYLLWYAMFNSDKNILIASNKNDNAMEMIYRIKYAYENLPDWLKPGITDDGWNKHQVGFDNDTRIISTATSEDSGRGMSISLLFLDEFAFVKPNIQNEFWTSISPTLSTGGSCIMSSTPNGDTNLFAQLWRRSQVDNTTFYPIRVRWDEPPGRDDKWKEAEIGRVGERRWLQEYECEFLSSDALLIDSMVLQSLQHELEDSQQPLFKMNDIKFWNNVERGHTYIVGVDPATGSGNDFSVIEVFEFPSLKQVAEYRSNTMSSLEVYKKLKVLLSHIERQHATAFFSVENNGVGEGLIALYEADENPPYSDFLSDSKDRYGMNTNGRTKIKACMNLKELIESGRLKIQSNIISKELGTFVRYSGSYRAQLGSTDDCISAVLISIRILEEMATYDIEAHNKLYSFEEEEEDMVEYDENMDDDFLPVVV